jgi:hypothetical protein
MVAYIGLSESLVIFGSCLSHLSTFVNHSTMSSMDTFLQIMDIPVQAVPGGWKPIQVSFVRAAVTQYSSWPCHSALDLSHNSGTRYVYVKLLCPPNLTLFLTAVLIFRTWAIFGKRKTMGIVAFVSYAATMVVVLWLVVQSLEQVKCMSDVSPWDSYHCPFSHSRPKSWPKTLHSNQGWKSW